MPAVSNSSPLIHLSALGDLDLLPRLFGHISIPVAVFREVVEEGSGQPGAREVETAIGEWITVHPVQRSSAVNSLMDRTGIHHGEAEAIVLAGELQSRMLLLDDQAAVTAVGALSLTVIRTPAVYIAAKRAGLTTSVRPKLDGLRKSGFRLRESHYQFILKSAGEL
ncbi:MAG: DUF3368 domain-containing protein [Bryobacterales bacterium]|nr:DUF3368 domain-containing protein [Bryobacterales bacterium]